MNIVSVKAQEAFEKFTSHIWSIVASSMLAQEWARSGAMVSRELNSAQPTYKFVHMKLCEPDLHPSNARIRRTVSGLVWLARLWGSLTFLHLEINCPLPPDNPNAQDALDEIMQGNGPNSVQFMLLRDVNIGQEETTNPDFLVWMLSQMSRLLFLDLDSPIGEMPPLAWLVHLRLVLTDSECPFDVTVSEALQACPSLRTLLLDIDQLPMDFESVPDDEEVMVNFNEELDFRALKLVRFGVVGVISNSVHLNKGCAAYLQSPDLKFPDVQSVARLTTWLCKPWEESFHHVDILDARYFSEQGFDLSIVRQFPYIKHLNLDGDELYSLDAGEFSVDLRSLLAQGMPRLEHLTSFRLSCHGDGGGFMIITVVLPSHLPLRDVTVDTDEAVMHIEIPAATAASIVHLQILANEISGNVSDLEDGLVQRNLQLTELLQPATGEELELRCMYIRQSGEAVLSMEDAIKSSRACNCGVCLDCLQRSGQVPRPPL